MREIKFRGKTPDGKWVYGLLTHDCNDENIECLSISESWTKFHEVIPETVGQFTGLQDNNGKDIYEGDLLEVITNKGKHSQYMQNCIVVFKDSCFQLEHENKRTSLFPTTKSVEIEVIDNIHDLQCT